MDKHAGRVIKYYNKVQKSYDRRWMNEENLAMHMGFWDSTTKSLHDALINENKYLANELNPNKEDLILDAGCGVGGTAIWLAENFGAEVKGITIVNKQVKRSLENAAKRNVQDLVSFENQNYCHTKYLDEQFTKIYFMESLCHSDDKKGALREAYRLLKPNGICVIIDAHLIKDKLTEHDRSLLQDWYQGWACAYLANVEDLRKDAKAIGFKEINFLDVTAQIMPSSKALLAYCKNHYKVKKWARLFKTVSKERFGNTKASISQFYLFQDQVVGYHILTLRK